MATCSGRRHRLGGSGTARPGAGGGWRRGLDGFSSGATPSPNRCAVRVGGAADDRVLGVEPGNSERRRSRDPAVRRVDADARPLPPAARGRRVQRHGAFQRRAGNAHRERRTPAVATFLGRDLRATSPSRRSRRAGRRNPAGPEHGPLQAAGSAGYASPERTASFSMTWTGPRPYLVGFDALSDTGRWSSAGRRTAESFPARRFRVRLAPSAISFVPPSMCGSRPDSVFRCTLQSTVLPGGSLGPALMERRASPRQVSLQSSDPEGFRSPATAT